MAIHEVPIESTSTGFKIDLSGHRKPAQGSPDDDPELRTAICDWLRANGIDPALVPAAERPDCSYRDGHGVPHGGHTITTRVRIRVSPEHSGVAMRYGANRLEEATVTKPMKVPPPLIVQQYLDAKCPTCGR